MALTRKLLKGMGLTDEQVDTIIEAHTEVTEGLKSERDRYKTDAERLLIVQKELDEVKQAADGGYKEKFEKERADFARYKADAAAKEASAQKTTLYRELLKQAGVDTKRIDAVMKVTDLTNVSVKDGKLEKAEELMQSIRTDWSDFIVQERQQGANVENPPTGSASTEKDLGTLSMADYIAARKKK